MREAILKWGASVPSVSGSIDDWRVHGIPRQDVTESGSLATWILQSFDGVRAYHGTRLASPDSVRNEGLRVLRADQMRRLAQRQIAELRCPGVTPEAIERTMEGIPIEDREGRVWFCFLGRTLLSSPSDHYCRYGSEYVWAIASRVCDDHERRLEAVGRPYVITCNLSWDVFDEESLNGLASSLASIAFEACETKRPMPELSGGFCVRRSVPARCIVDIQEISGLKTVDQEEQENDAIRRELGKFLNPTARDMQK